MDDFSKIIHDSGLGIIINHHEWLMSSNEPQISLLEADHPEIAAIILLHSNT